MACGWRAAARERGRRARQIGHSTRAGRHARSPACTAIVSAASPARALPRSMQLMRSAGASERDERPSPHCPALAGRTLSQRLAGGCVATVSSHAASTAHAAAASTSAATSRSAASVSFRQRRARTVHTLQGPSSNAAGSKPHDSHRTPTCVADNALIAEPAPTRSTLPEQGA